MKNIYGSFGIGRQTIICIDMDSYFATVEQQENPYLRGQPVGILKSLGRTCVIAASKEAKEYGIKTGMALSEVQKRCPSIILVPADMEKYFFVTKRFSDICRRYTPLVEMFSIDELFMDVTSGEQLFGGALAIALEIKDRVRKEIGDWISCSVGISYNKFLAKLASKKNKPDGLFVITPQNKDKVILETKLTDVCGIGRRLEERLMSMGVSTFSQLRQLPDSTIAARLGPHWPTVLKNIANGESEDVVVNPEGIIAKQKSVSRTYTLFADTYDPRVVKQYVRNLSEEVAWKLREMDLCGRSFSLSIRGGEQGTWGHRTLKRSTNDGKLISELAWDIFRKFDWELPVRFVGVHAELLADSETQTEFLFESDRQRKKLLQTMDAVNNKFGTFTLYPGILVDGEKVKPEVNGYLGDKGFRARQMK